MKHSSGPTNLSDSVRQRLNRFAIATILFVGTLALPAEAKIVYTHVNITITGNGSIRFGRIAREKVGAGRPFSSDLGRAHSAKHVYNQLHVGDGRVAQTDRASDF